jgi:hypothetical protein
VKLLLGCRLGERLVVFLRVLLSDQTHLGLMHETARLPLDAHETRGDRRERCDASIEVFSKIMPLVASLG